MLDRIVCYHWFDLKGRVVTTFFKENIPTKTPYIIKLLEDLTPKICITTLRIPNTDIFEVLVLNEDKTPFNEIIDKVDIMTKAMLRVANKEMKRW